MKKEKAYNEAINGDEGFEPGDGYPSCDGEPCANVSDEPQEETDTMADGADSGAAPDFAAAAAEWQDKYIRLGSFAAPRRHAPSVRNCASVNWVASSRKIQSYSCPWYSTSSPAP